MDAQQTHQKHVEHWEERVEQLWNSAQLRHEGNIKLRAKHEALWLWIPLHWLWQLFTLGQGVNLVDGNYYTLFGRTLWLPGDGTGHEKRAPHLVLSIMSHEIDHLDHLYFGDHDARNKSPEELKKTSIWFRILHHWKYFFWPLPIRFARYREQIETWGHERNLEQHLVVNGGKCARWYRKWLVMQFVSATYGWICQTNRAFDLVDEMIVRVEGVYLRGELDVYKTEYLTTDDEQADNSDFFLLK